MGKEEAERFIQDCLVKPGTQVRLENFDPGFTIDQKKAAELFESSLKALQKRQECLYSADTWSILLILQGMDTSGKDSAIRHILTGLNPQGCRVVSFSHPSATDLDHNFLWRYSRELPERGHIAVFNRSYYEEVLIVRVHPHILEAQRVPGANQNAQIWHERFDDINSLERHLTRNGTAVLKFFLHLSPEEQRKRLLARLENPKKLWKFSKNDIEERKFWDDYENAYEAALTETSTSWAPWYVIPADHKWMSRTVIAGVLAHTISKLELSYPPVSADRKKQIEAAKQTLKK